MELPNFFLKWRGKYNKQTESLTKIIESPFFDIQNIGVLKRYKLIAYTKICLSALFVSKRELDPNNPIGPY